MTPSKQEGTAAAAEQLGAMSLGESVKKEDNETEPNAENGTTSTKMCSACEKKSNTLMKCRACKCVWYCDKDCQNKHWREHKKECKPIKKELDKRGGKLDVGREMDVGPLGKLPPREECSICMQVLPLHAMLSTYAACCGKFLCSGCNFQHQMKSGERPTCAFCREPISQSAEEALVPLRKRVERKDPNAMFHMALEYGYGLHGLSVDHAKCIDLLRESAGLGCHQAHVQLGNFYHDGEMDLEQNEEEALKYWKRGAEGGHLKARHNVGCIKENGDLIASMRHLRLAASGGYRKSIVALITCFEGGWLRHRDLAESLQAMYLARSEMRSDGRDRHIKHLKETGKYEAYLDW